MLDQFVGLVESALTQARGRQGDGDHAICGFKRGFDPRRVAHQLRTALFTQAPPSGTALKGGLDILRQSDLRENLSSVAQPVLVLHGEKDSVTPVTAGQYLAGHLPHARFELFADCGHAPFLSDADRVAALIEAFVSE